jgi:hypothetical protein
LIALIINVHTLGRMLLDELALARGSLIRKTSLLRKINPMMRRSSFTNKDGGSITSCDGQQPMSWR